MTIGIEFFSPFLYAAPLPTSIPPTAQPIPLAPPGPPILKSFDPALSQNFTNGSTEDALITIPSFNGSTSPVQCPATIQIFGQEYMIFRYVVDVYFLPFVIIFGIVGNTLAFFVLADMKEAATTVVLRTLAITDSLYLVNCFFFQTLETLYSYDDMFAKLFWFLPYWKARVIWPLANTVQTTGVWLVILVTAERYSAVHRPLETKMTLTKRRNRIWILMIISLAVIFNAPCHLDLRVIRMPVENCPNLRPLEAMAVPLITNYYYNLFYKTLACLLLRSVGPVLALIVLNGKLVQEIHKSRSGLQTNQSSSKTSHHMTEMVALVVGAFILCQIPDATFRILRTFKTYDSSFGMDWKAFAIMATFANMFVTMNSAINFLLYCVRGKNFRKFLKRRMGRTKRQLRETFSFNKSDTSSTFMTTSMKSVPKKADVNNM